MTAATVCGSCGFENSREDGRFCRGCGAVLASAQSVRAAARDGERREAQPDWSPSVGTAVALVFDEGDVRGGWDLLEQALDGGVAAEDEQLLDEIADALSQIADHLEGEDADAFESLLDSAEAELGELRDRIWPEHLRRARGLVTSGDVTGAVRELRAELQEHEDDPVAVARVVELARDLAEGAEDDSRYAALDEVATEALGVLAVSGSEPEPFVSPQRPSAAVPPPARAARPPDAAAPLGVADELRKLADLLNEGIITREELELQKRRLLGT